jgi:hypothetical protein
MRYLIGVNETSKICNTTIPVSVLCRLSKPNKPYKNLAVTADKQRAKNKPPRSSDFLGLAQQGVRTTVKNPRHSAEYIAILLTLLKVINKIKIMHWDYSADRRIFVSLGRWPLKDKETS